MTKRKFSTKQSLIASILVLAMCFSALIGTTFAWFTDSVTSANNIIKTGNLDIELEYAKVTDGALGAWATVEGKSDVFDPNALWEPGRVEVVYLKVSNLGSLALKYQLQVNVNEEKSGTNVYDEEFKISDHLVFKVVDVENADGTMKTYDDREAVTVAAGTELGLKDYNGKTTPLAVGNTDYVALIVYMPESVGNTANYKTGTAEPYIKLGINLIATQQTAEDDSFGDDYDEDAWAPEFNVFTAQELQTAINAGETNIKLMDNIEANESIVIPASAATTYSLRAASPTVTIDLNGKTINGNVPKSDGHVIENYGNAKINGGTVSSVAENGGSAIYNAAGAVMELNNLTVNGAPMVGSAAWPSYGINNYGEMTINGATVSTHHGGVATSGDGVTVINDANISVNQSELGHNTSWVFYTSGNGKLIINDGEFANTKTEYPSYGGGIFSSNSTNPIEVNGGKFTQTIKNGEPIYTGTAYDINGGTFNFEISAIAPDCEVTENEDGTVTAKAYVAKVGNTSYTDIDEAIANWTHNTTLTLLKDVTLTNVITLKSTEHHKLDLGTYTMTAASGKNAIEITCNGLSNATYALTINADSENTGGITAMGKACIYYSKSGTAKDRPIILINNGVFNGSYSINSKSNGNTNCPQFWINGGTFNGNVNLTKNMLKVSGGTFNGWINCTGDQSAYRQITGGKFKLWQFMTADAPNKFVVGSAKGVDANTLGTYDVGLYVDDNGYLVVGGAVITEAGDKFAASSTNYSGWSNYLKYSSAKENGLYYTSAYEAFADNNNTSGVVTVYVDELDMTGVAYKGTINIVDTLTVTYAEGTTPTWTVASGVVGKAVTYTETVSDGVVTRTCTLG